MKILKNILDFYINSSIHVGLSIACLTYMTFVNADYKVNFKPIFFSLFATISIYNTIKYLKIFQTKKPKNLKLNTICYITFFCLIMSLYFLFEFSILTISILFLASIVIIFYSVKIFPPISKLRNSSLKIHSVALVWTIVSAIAPLIEISEKMDFELLTIKNLIWFLNIYTLIILLMLIFEIVDFKKDYLKVNTIPHKIGITKTKTIGYITFFICLCLNLLLDKKDPTNLFVNTFPIILSVVFLAFASVNKSKYYSAFWAESIPIIWFCIYLLVFAER